MDVCVVVLLIPRAVVCPGSSLSKKGAKQESGISWHPEQFCDSMERPLCLTALHPSAKRFTLIQEIRGTNQQGSFLVFLWEIWFLSVMEQPGSVWAHWFLVSSVLCCQPVSTFPPDHPLLFLQIMHCFDVPSCFCVKVTTVSLFLGCARAGLSSLFIRRQNYSHKGTLASAAFAASPWELGSAGRREAAEFTLCPFGLCGEGF